MDLELLDFTPEKLLIAVTRATRARYRYVHLCNAQGINADPVVEHQLTNHITLLQNVARAAELSEDSVDDAVRAGVDAARSEA